MNQERKKAEKTAEKLTYKLMRPKALVSIETTKFFEAIFGVGSENEKCFH